MMLPCRAADLARTLTCARRHEGRGDPGQENARRDGGSARPWGAGAALLVLAGALGACSSTGGSHEPTLAEGPGRTAQEQAAAEIRSFTQRIDGTTVTIEMVRIAAGSEGAPALWMSRTEIPWDLYNVYVYGLDEPEGAGEVDGITRPSKPYVPPDRGFGTNGYPAMGMTFHAAEAFCQWLSVRTGRTYRLPTEEEWAAACSAGRGARADETAWHSGNAANKTHPVGQKPGNELGLHDMLGNVAEWVVGTDGKPVACGGSYLDAPATISCETRERQTPAWNTSDPQIPKSRWWLADCSFVGFRIVCEGEAAAR